MILFTDILRQIRRGRVVDAASVELASVVRDAVATGKPGELTLKLKVTPDKGDSTVVRLSAEIKTKSPREDLPDAMFFAGKDGALLREDPEKVLRFAEANLDADEELDRETGEVRTRAN